MRLLVVVSALAVGVVGCCATSPPRPPVVSASPHPPAAGDARPTRLVEVRPPVVAYASLGKAAEALRSPLPDHAVDLLEAAGLHETFFFEIPFGHFHESSTLRSRVAAVFVRGSRVVAMPGLLEVAHPMPSSCGVGRQGEGIAIALHGRIAHVRVLRAEVADAPTLAAQPYLGKDPHCATLSTFRVEDHFVDVESAEHLLVLGQSFVGPAHGPRAALPGVPFEAFLADDGGVQVGDDRWFWND